MTLKIDASTAATILRQQTAANGSGDLEELWTTRIKDLSQLCEASGSDSPIAILGTAILARCSEPIADPRAFKCDEDNPRSYSARSLFERVLSPLSRELGFHPGSRSAFLNQPYREMSRLHNVRNVRPAGRAAFDLLMQLVSDLDLANPTTARGSLCAFISIRSRYVNRLERLLKRVSDASSSNEKGDALETLCCALFDEVPGFSVDHRRKKTSTEEIDIIVLNDSQHPKLRREAAQILVECKNWTESCGRNELVLFKQKIENRSGRCSIGFLISWNGFTTTVTKEMLRGSRELVLAIPVTGEEIRFACISNNAEEVLLKCWDRAVNL